MSAGDPFFTDAVCDALGCSWSEDPVEVIRTRLAELAAARTRAHALANRCMGAELVLAELVEWRAKWAAVRQPSAIMAFEEFDEIAKLLPSGERAVVDPPGTATTDAAVDGGGVAGGCASASPGSLQEVADDAVGSDPAGKGPAGSTLRASWGAR